jgi:hypothetical protein
MPLGRSGFETAIFSASFEEIETHNGSANLKDELIMIQNVFPASKDGKKLLEEGILIRVKAEDDISIFATADLQPRTSALPRM